MTVSSQICKRIYQADGENRQWAIDFPYLSSAELKVYVTDEAGLETEVTSQCVLDEIEQEIIYPSLASTQDPLPSGNTLTILRVTTPTQTLHLTQQGTLDAAALEKGFDKLTLQVQELAEQTKRSIKYPVSSAKTDVDAQNFLADLHSTQAAALSTALAEVGDLKASLEQTVADEESARVAADHALQAALGEKQNALSAAQQQAVNSHITSARVVSYDAHLLQTNNPHAVTKEQLGLGNVDNTSDMAKPISYATQEALERIDDELEQNRPWQKPADWVDIRSGAFQNSVYYLVGHRADYSLYPTFKFAVQLSDSSHTADIFVDGIKIMTAPHNTEVTLDWQQLALETGLDITYPAAFRAHVVRVTPTVSADTLVSIQTHNTLFNGILWIHLALNYVFNVKHIANRSEYLVAFTADGDRVLFDDSRSTNQYGLGYAFRYAGSKTPDGVLHLPVFEGSNSGIAVYCYHTFYEAKINCAVRYKNCLVGNTTETRFWTAKNCTTENAAVGLTSIMRGPHIKRIPTLLPTAFAGTSRVIIENLPNLGDTIIDFSGNTQEKYFDMRGTSSSRIDGLKGLTVSSEAPFDGESPQINVPYTGLGRQALRQLFKSMPTVSAGQVCNITGATGAADLTAEDLAIATDKGWTITR